MAITIIVKKNPQNSRRAIRFESRQVPAAKQYQERSNVSNRHMSVVIPVVEGMDRSELKEYAHELREKLHRDDITEDTIAAKVEEKHNPVEKVSSKPYMEKRRREQGLA
jgi:divalent metal cation (Fe/Co/Zn/Cd) transporter